MRTAFFISIGYAALGVAYAPGRHSLVAFAFIFLSCLPLLAGSLFESRLDVKAHRAPGPLLFWGLFALGLLNLAVIAASVDRSPLEILSPGGFASIATASTLKRYGEQGSSGNPVIQALSLFLVYRLGAADADVSGWRKFAGFVPLVLYSFLTTEKWILYLSGIFFLSGLLVSPTSKEDNRAALRYMALFAVLGGGLAILSIVMRGFVSDPAEVLMLVPHYLFAPFPAFGYWLLEEAAEQCCSLGALTFIGPLDALGLVYREPGVFLTDFNIYGMDTNIYTSWRYLVQDFSFFGPFLINLALSILFIAFLRARLHAAADAIRGYVIFASFMSISVTPFVFNSTAFALILALTYSAVLVRLALPSFRMPVRAVPAAMERR